MEGKAMKDVYFLDESVVVPKGNFDFKCLKSNRVPSSCPTTTIKEAQLVEIDVICQDPKVVLKLQSKKENCKRLLKDFLLQFKIVEGCFVLCDTSPLLKFHSVFVRKLVGKAADAYFVSDKTEVVIGSVMSLQMFDARKDDVKFDEIFNGDPQTETLPRIAKIIQDAINPPSISLPSLTIERNLLLVGPPGCGKSSLIHFIARKTHTIISTLPCNDLTHENLENTVGRAINHSLANEPCLLLIKDLHLVEKRPILKLLLDSIAKIGNLFNPVATVGSGAPAGVCIVATTSSPEEVDMSLRTPGCFSQELEVPMLTEEDRAVVLAMLGAVFDVSVGLETVRRVAQWTPGYVLADLVAVFRQIQAQGSWNADQELEIFRKAVSSTMPTLLRNSRHLINDKKTSFADIGGLENVKKILRMNVKWQLQHPEAFLRLGVPPTRGLLLYGPPGCAKTTLVKALASESSATFLAVSAAELYSPYVGESEKRLSKLFREARVGAPSVVFIDEIDALVGSKSGSRDHGVQERILATLLMEMDGVGVTITTSDALTKLPAGQETANNIQTTKKAVSNQRIVVVGATNRPELIDDALKRPGRFDKLVHVPLPDLEERLCILRTVTLGMSLASDVSLEDVAKRSECCSGAHLKNICNESGLLALSKRGMDADVILMEDFEDAMVNYRNRL